ncbi:MAG: GtrA family protein [Ancalomicrobiaceae bacterium]|nr:GtrA family protein [Ancalomicrobiaceae bacterium]
MSAAATPPTPARRSTARRIAGFAVVGFIGFGSDAAVTLCLIGLGFNAFLGRALAILLAMATTYLLNRTLTFRDSADHDPARIAGEATRYILVAVGSAIFNWLVYSAALVAVPGLPPIVAIVMGSAAAMVASYLGYSRYAFRGRGGQSAP